MAFRKPSTILVAACAALALAAPGTATAAPAAPLTAQVLTPAQLPGFSVVVEPKVQPRSAGSGRCEIADPKGSVTVATSLGREGKASADRVQVLMVTEQATRLPSAAAARTLFAKLRAVGKACGGASKVGGVTATSKVSAAPVVPGASRAFAVLVTGSGTQKVQGKTVKLKLASRSVIYLSGRHVVVIAPSRTLVRTSGSTATSVSVNDAFTRKLGTRAAKAAISLLAAG